MPILNVKVSAQRTPELSARIAETLLDLTTRVLGKRRDLTAVVITCVDPADWYIAGRSLADLKQSSFYFDAKVVATEKVTTPAGTFDTFRIETGGWVTGISTSRAPARSSSSRTMRSTLASTRLPSGSQL